MAGKDLYIVQYRSLKPGGEGDSPYERDGDGRRLAYGYKFRILVSLRVFWAKRHHNYLAVKVSFRVAREKI